MKKTTTPRGVKKARLRRKPGEEKGAERPYCAACGEYFDTTADAAQHVMESHPSDGGPSPEDIAKAEAESAIDPADPAEAGEPVEVA